VAFAVPRFADVTMAAGLAGVEAQYLNWLDVDGDPLADLLVNGHRLFRNLSAVGAPRFEEITAAAGLSGAKPAPALALDIDNDGRTDIVSTAGQLWRHGEDGTFTDIAARAGFMPHPKSLTLGAGDIDGDGFADLYIGTVEDWNDGNPVYYPHQLWHNLAGARFEEIGERAGIARKVYGRSVLFGDVDGDGRPDIFVAAYRLQPNLLWRNLGRGRFQEAAAEWGVTGRRQPEKYYDNVTRRRYGPAYGHTIGACWLDLDNDGHMDLFTANLAHKYVGPTGDRSMGYDIRGYVCDDSAIYRRTVRGFEDWREALGVPVNPIGGPAVFKGDELWAGCVAGDANNDTWTDVFVPQIYDLPYARSLLFLNREGGRLEDHAVDAGVCRLDTYAGALADVDGDGWLDVATGGRQAVGAPPSLRLYHNAGCQAGDTPRHWLRVRVHPAPGHRTAVGTVLTMRLGAVTLTRWVTAGTSSYGQQDDPIVHFGLGSWSGNATLWVRWPDGSEMRVPVVADSLVEVLPPASAALVRP